MLIKGEINSNIGFYIGDVCYVLNRDYYDEDWGKKHKYRDGCYTNENGIGYIVASTKYGDGWWPGSDNHAYPVDAGVIGIVSAEIADPNSYNDWRFVDKPGTAYFEAEDGLFEIYLPGGEKIMINTGDVEE